MNLIGEQPDRAAMLAYMLCVAFSIRQKIERVKDVVLFPSGHSADQLLGYTEEASQELVFG